VSGDGGLAGLRRRLAELRAELENPRPKKQRRRRRDGMMRAAVGDVSPMSSAGAGGRAFSAAGRSLDAAGDGPTPATSEYVEGFGQLPRYGSGARQTLRRSDGSTVSTSDPNVGPN
jgi:hypothetical protein